MGNPWIGIDLDGTLAKTDDALWSAHGLNYVGEPVEKMVNRVKQWLAQGIEVRIVTARVSREDKNNQAVRRPIVAWCIYHIGRELPITNEKDYDMVLLYDDRARQVVENTGEIVGEESTD
jgi:hypothetical protein